MVRKILERAFAALAAFAGALVFGSAQAQSTDIDIYSGASPSSDRPNVLLVLDSSANWNPSVGANCWFQDNGVNNGQPTDQGSKYAVELCALYNTVDRLRIGDGDVPLFNVGIMLTNASPDSNKGGYPLVAFKPLTAANKVVLKNAIRAIANNPTYKANLAQFSLMLHEAYLWFKGLPPRVGNLNNFYDSAAFGSDGRYVSPSANSCGRNYIILIANGAPTNGENSTAGSLLAGLGGAAAAGIITDPAQGTHEANFGDEYARFLRSADVSGKEDVQGIITHTVAVVDPGAASTSPEKRYRAYARSTASYGGGNYFEASETNQMVTQLLSIFNQIQAVNSVFASASLPVAVNARGTYLNQVFLGMFRPDANAKPRWRGNLKQYRFGLDDSNNLFLMDAAGYAAISASTGFVSPGAVSYWTSSSSYWSAEPMGTPPSVSDRPDGEVVEKGGAGQRLRTTFATSQDARKVYTCIGCSTGTVLGSSSDTQFTSGNTLITNTMLGAADATERGAIINWVRGNNNASELVPTTDPVTTVRPSVHGDVLHSRPAVLNYGGSTGVVVFYGGNDGLLHAVNGNQGGTGAGEELWSFAPHEHFGKLKRLRDNSPNIKLSTTPSGGPETARDFFVDGPIGMYMKRGSGDSVDKAIIIMGMRRGGRQLYALDVTNPASPRFLWKISNATFGFSLLGQTWSEPRVTRVKGQNDPVLIFGGGYDANEDTSGATTMGNAIFVVNAFTGELLRTFTTLAGTSPVQSIARPVAADVTLLDTDYDGVVDRAYALDLGGQVYRIDFEAADGSTLAANAWTIYKIADLSGGTSTGRKFFYAPDVVLTKSFAALLFGSGDREKPLLTATEDHFFQIFDRRMSKGAPSVAAPFAFASLVAMGTTPNLEGNGCYMSLTQGEKVVNAATSIAGNAYFGTNRPSASSAAICTANLGIAKTYAMPLFCVASGGSVLTGGGLPPSPVAGIVNVVRASDGQTVQVPFVIGAPNARGSAIEVTRVRPTIDTPRKRRYWYQETQR